MLEDLTVDLNIENHSYNDPTTELKRDISNDDLVERGLPDEDPTNNLVRKITNQDPTIDLERKDLPVKDSKEYRVELKAEDHQEGSSTIGPNDACQVEYGSKPDLLPLQPYIKVLV